MEPQPAAAKYVAGHSIELHLFSVSSSYQDPDIMEVSSSWGSRQQKRKRSQVVPHDIIDIGDDDPDEVDDPDGVVIIGESTSDYKNKQPMRYDMDRKKQIKDSLSNKHVGSSTNHLSENDAPLIEDEIGVKFKLFKQFDTVQDHSDHYFSSSDFIKRIPVVKKPPKDWAKRIQHEWKVLEKDLPETIYVRVYEDRMDLLRALIIGPAGTPYHDGLFFFDVFFPPNYPQVPPMLHYHAGGLRLNPNLYECGKVCLSLLGTWSGSGCEQWNPSNSTMLQVLVSIQALVLNAKPYFNEPGYAATANTPYGNKKSLLYNEEAYLLSCKTMQYSLRGPPKHFEDFVAGYFRKQGHAILVACRAYMNGAQVGCVVGGGVQDVDEGDKSSSPSFKNLVKIIFEQLLMVFTVKGADCGEFLAQKVKDGDASGADTTLKL